MDTKWKKRNIGISFAVFFLSVSLLVGNGVLLLGHVLDLENGDGKKISSLYEKDYQNTVKFRRFMQGRLSNFLAMGAGIEKVGGYGYFDVEGTYWVDDVGFLDSTKEYHETVKKDKNLLYQIVRDGKVLYTNMEGGRWEKSSTQPAGYNFFLYFDGQKVSASKDKKELKLYGDGYYRDDSQWYVPGYENFTADETMKNVEVVMFAAQNPVSYSYVKYEEGGYGQTDSRLYEIYKEVCENRKRVVWITFGLAAGAVLFVYQILARQVRGGKKEVKRAIARFMGRIWFEAKLVVLFAMVAGIVGIVRKAPNALNEWTGFDTNKRYEFQIQEENAIAGDLASILIQGTAAPVQDDLKSLDEFAVENETSFANVDGEEERTWMEWETRLAVWHGLCSFFSNRPLLLLLYFWLCYLLLLDLLYNRQGVFNGAIQTLLRKAKTDSLKQPFAVSQVRRVAAGTAAGMAACAALMLITLLFGIGYFNKTEAAVAQCSVAAVLLAVLVRTVSGIRGQAEELDLLAAQIQSVQSGAEKKAVEFAEDSSLKTLSDGILKIRQGMEAAIFEQLKSERMKVELVANVSHDLKTPLTSIISYLAFLKQEEGLPAHVQDYIRILNQKAGRLNSMVQDVFAVSQAASGDLPVELKVLDYAKLLHQTLADMQEQILRSPVTIKTEIKAQPVRIRADGTRLYRVFQNLIQNALQYSLEGSRVFLTLREEGGFAYASIKNTSRQELCSGADFTERFVRGDESRTDGGAGLGLSIAKSFTEACGGSFALETDADLFAVTVGFAVSESEAENN